MRKIIIWTAILLVSVVLAGCNKQKTRIELQEDYVQIKVNEEYDLMTGVKAYDNKDKDITDKIEVDSTGFSVYFEGTYEIKYVVGKVSKTRTITVEDTSESFSPVLTNASHDVVNGYSITKIEHYNRMKKMIGMETLLQLIDGKLYENVVIDQDDLEEHYNSLEEKYGEAELINLFINLGYYQFENETSSDYHNRLLDYLKLSHQKTNGIEQTVENEITDEQVSEFKENYREDRCIIFKNYSDKASAETFINSLQGLSSNEILTKFTEDYSTTEKGEDESYLASLLPCDYDRFIYRDIKSEDLKTLLFDTLNVSEHNTEPFQSNNQYYVFYVVNQAPSKAGYDQTKFEENIIDILVSEKLTDTYKTAVTYQNREKVNLKIYDPYLANIYKQMNSTFPGVTDTDDKSLVASIDDYVITADMFYDKLKKENGVPTLLTEINYHSLAQIESIDLTEEDEAEILEQIDQVIKKYESSGYFNYGISGIDFLSYYYNVLTLEELKHKFAVNYLSNRYILGYKKDGQVLYEGKNPVTDTQIENESFSATARHILYSFDKYSKEEAYQKAMENINEFKSVTPSELESTFITMASVSSDDRGTELNNKGLLKVTPGIMVLPFEEAVKELINTGVNSFTHEPVETEYGYHVVYLKSVDTLPVKPDNYDSLTDKELEDILTNHTNNDVEAYYNFITPIIRKLERENYTQAIVNSELMILRNSQNVLFNQSDLENHYQAINGLNN